MERTRHPSRWLRPALAALIVASLLPHGVAAVPTQVVDPPTRPAAAITPNFSTSYQTRPELPADGIDLHLDEPDYVDEGSGTTDSEADVPTDAPGAGALDTTGLLTPAIRAYAQSLGDNPRAIFESLRNTFEYEPYYFGLVKGTQETLDQRAGNSVDLATLLVTLLRSGGTPARYAQRVVKIPAATAASWVGVRDPIVAARILASGGTSVTVTIRSGQPTALMFEHVWVEAYVTTGGKKGWKALDPSYKLHTIRNGRNPMADAGMTGEELRTDLLGASNSAGPTGTVHTVDLDRVNEIVASRMERLTDHLETTDPDLTLNEVVGGTDILAETFSTLPSRPPYRGRGSTTRFDAVADAAKQKVRIRVFGLDHTLAIADIASKKLTVGYAPATSADTAAISAAGGLLKVQPGSVNLRPQLRLDGAVVAQGNGGPVGSFAFLAVDFMRGTASLGQSLHVASFGGVYAIILDTQSVPVAKIQRSRDRLAAANDAGGPMLGDTRLGEMAHALGLGYFRYNDLVTEYLAGTQNAVAFHQVSEALVSHDLVADHTVSPARMAYGSYQIDVKRNIYSLYDSANSPDFRTFPLLYAIGSASSALEHVFLKTMVGWQGVSTMQLMSEAGNDELKVQGIGPENASSVLPTLNVSSSVKSEIQSAVNGGRRVIIPTKNQFIADWRGASWIDYSPQTGAAGFLLSGGLKGGAVAFSLYGLTPEQQEAIRNADASALEAFLNGLITGDFNREGYSDPLLEILRVGGQIISGLVVIGDIRDAAAAIQKLQQTGLQDGWLDLGLSLIGMIPLFGDAVKFAKGGDEIITVVLKASDEVDDITRAFDDVLGAGNSADVIATLVKSSDAGFTSIRRISLDGVATTAASVTKNGIHVDAMFVDGPALFARLGLPTNVGTAAARGRAGEVVSDAVARQNGWSRIDIKADPTAAGIDRIYLDQATGRYKVIEAKFFEGGDVNFSTGKLATTVDSFPERELADAWLYKAADGSLNDAIQRSVLENSITPNQAADLRRAFENGNLDKELVIVKNDYDGRTISDGFGSSLDLGTGSGNPIHSTIVEIGKLLPLP